MMKNLLLVTALLVAFVIIGTACGKKEAGPSGNAPAAEAVPSAAQPAAAGTAENLGNKIGSSYIETLKQVVAILKDKPAAADAKAMLRDMKDWTIELMVGLGKERQAMSAGDRAVVDRIASNRIAMVPADLFKDYQAGQAFYKDDTELYRLIAEFNIITQYAFFDLLKKQLPGEAKRLGID
jgi:hypothetical protein